MKLEKPVKQKKADLKAQKDLNWHKQAPEGPSAPNQWVEMKAKTMKTHKTKENNHQEA